MEFSNFEDVVKFAIEREEAAYEAYGDMREMVDTPGLKEMLSELQSEEENHKKLLQDISQSKIEEVNAQDIIDLKISDYLTEEAPSADMTFQDLLVLAAKKEQEAVDLYSGMKKAAGTEDLIKLFDFLIEDAFLFALPGLHLLQVAQERLDAEPQSRNRFERDAEPLLVGVPSSLYRDDLGLRLTCHRIADAIVHVGGRLRCCRLPGTRRRSGLSWRRLRPCEPGLSRTGSRFGLGLR